MDYMWFFELDIKWIYVYLLLIKNKWIILYWIIVFFVFLNIIVIFDVF